MGGCFQAGTHTYFALELPFYLLTSAYSCSWRIKFSFVDLSRSTCAVLRSSSDRKAADLPGHWVPRSSLDEQAEFILRGVSATLANYAGCAVLYCLGPPRAEGTEHLSRFSTSGESCAQEVRFGWFQLPTLCQHLPKCLIFTGAM